MSYQKIWDGRSGYEGKRRHPLRNFLLILLGLGILVFGALEIYIAAHDDTNIVGQPKTMVIFGCKVEKDGPSILLRDRLDTALDYLKDHPDMKIVVTGGKGDDEHQSEAQCMYDYLTAHGVNGDDILMEDRARNTCQNVLYTCQLVELAIKGTDGGEEKRWDTDASEKVLVVSSGFHLSRIEMLMDRHWVSNCTVSTLAAPVSHKPSAVQMFFREPLALVKSFVFDR